MENGLAGKGVVLTQISRFWFDYFGTIPHHLVSTDVEDVTGISDDERAMLKGRIMLCKSADVLPVECIARGYITGSGWKDYQKTGMVCGIPLPQNMELAQQLSKPLYTPSSKAGVGEHDANISFKETEAIVGIELATQIKEVSLKIYQFAAEHALSCGIIIADTKFEFGLDEDNQLTLMDEVLTPDSSRFWPAADYQPGSSPKSYDKQIIRDYLETLDWSKTPPAPRLPDNIMAKTSEKYHQVHSILCN